MNVETTIAAIDSQIAYLRTLGGKGSGNFGHSGRPGKVGGSAPKDGEMKTVPIGDCYEKAGRYFIFPDEAPEALQKYINDPKTRLVHAEVIGQGKAKGKIFGHAWIEATEEIPISEEMQKHLGPNAPKTLPTVTAYDYSNGRETIMPRELYYYFAGVGEFAEEEGKLFRYTREEARKKILESGHWGHWDLSTKY